MAMPLLSIAGAQPESAFNASAAAPLPSHPPATSRAAPLQAHLNRTTDRELLYLSAYLAKIAELDSLEGLNHK